MRILLVCLGSAGDVLPFVALGRELKRRKHWVAVVTNPYFKPVVEKGGLKFVSMGQVGDLEKALKDPHLYHPRRGLDVFYQCLVLPSIAAGYKAILRSYIPGQTVLVASRYSVAARIAQDKLQIPTISIVLTPYGLCKIQDSPRMTLAVNAFRAGVGLSRVTHVLSRWMFSPEKVVGLFPDWYAASQSDWPPHVHLTGFPLEDDYKSEESASSLNTFLDAGTPPIVFTPGTAMRHAKTFFLESAKACRNTGCRGIFVTPFDHQIPAGLPKGIIHVRSVPFRKLFFRARGVVHAGGIGTSAQAMAAGIPQLIVPLAFDQFDNAKRMQKLGIAHTLRADSYQSVRIGPSLSRLVTDRKIRAKCGEVAVRLRGVSGIHLACHEIEAYAGSRRIVS